MKNLIIALTTILAFAFSQTTFAQSAADRSIASVETVSMVDAEEVPIVQNFKATKSQKKVIKKMKKYVTPKIMGKRKNTAALAGKKVTVQFSLNQDGVITNMQIVKGFEESVDERVLELIQKYNTEKPLADTNITLPAIIQMEVPLVRKKGYMF